MPVLEKYEIQQNRIWYRVEITEEQKEEYLKWQANVVETDKLIDSIFGTHNDSIVGEA